MEQSTINQAYAYCETVCRTASTTFYSSFSALSLQKRKAVHAVYALCRWVDDIVDGDEEPSILETNELRQETDERQQVINEIHEGKTPSLPEDEHRRRLMALVDIRLKLHRAHGQDIKEDDHPIFIALQDVFSRYAIKLSDFETVLEGMEDDLYHNRYRTFDELYVYCYRVASVVGLMCIEIYGYEDENAQKYAESWGIFMQLTNVLRDVGEDIQRDRVYLPLDELENNDMTELELHDGKVVLNKHWEPYCHHYAKRARTYLKEARMLLPLLPRNVRYSPAAMIAFYDKILRKIEKAQGDVFTQRVKLSKAQKISLAATVYLRHRFLPGFLDPVWGGLAKLGILPKV